MGIANHPDVSQLGIRSKRMITDITNLPVLKVLLRHKKMRRVLSEDYSLGQGLLQCPIGLEHRLRLAVPYVNWHIAKLYRIGLVY